MIDDALLTAVEKELEKGACRLRFNDAVEARFEADTQQQRNRHMVWAGLLSAIIYCLFLINDYHFRPDAFTLSVLLRAGVMLPIGLPILWVVYRGVSPGLRELLMASTVILATVISCVIFMSSSTPYSYLDVFSFGLILLVGNIVYSLRFSYAVWSSLVSFFIIVVSIFGYESMPSEAKRLAIFLIIATGFFTLAANYRFERSERIAYLHVLRERIRTGYYLQDNQKLSHLTVTDALTNIANRRQFDTVFPVRWREAADQNSCLGLMVIDIDHFKAYNDYYGHPQGDLCLRQVATALQASSRDDDLVVRYGGEEFLILMINTTLASAETAAERVRHCVEALQIPNHGVSAQSVITVSIGVAVVGPTMGLTSSVLVSLADKALYEAKLHSRNCVWVVNGVDPASGDGAISNTGRSPP